MITKQSIVGDEITALFKYINLDIQLFLRVCRIQRLLRQFVLGLRKPSFNSSIWYCATSASPVAAFSRYILAIKTQYI